jgi:hypothetical protein
MPPAVLACASHARGAQGCKSWLIRKAIAAKMAGLSEGKYVKATPAHHKHRLMPCLTRRQIHTLVVGQDHFQEHQSHPGRPLQADGHGLRSHRRQRHGPPPCCNVLPSRRRIWPDRVRRCCHHHATRRHQHWSRGRPDAVQRRQAGGRARDELRHEQPRREPARRSLLQRSQRF